MQAFLDSLIAQGYFAGVPHEIVYAGGMIVFGLIVCFGFVLNVAGVTTWLERRVWARMQNRVGPNRVGPQGVLQWLADGIKLIMKEDIVPAAADARLFRLAPYIVVMGFLTAFVVIPFGSALVIADMNVGLVYLTAVTSLVVVGILMAGWSSNNKWSLIGGIRSAAQIVSYEIPAGLSLMPVVLITGTLSVQGIIQQQGWAPHQWFLFHNPFNFIAFFILFTSALAEGNRTPFDLPEAESELVSGFVTEYSGVRYLMFFLVEWGNLYVIGALLTIMFLGGWQIPPVTERPVPHAVFEFVTFFVKSYGLALVAMWVRATLPRVRVDQLMAMCWKYFVPISFVNMIGVAVWVAVWPEGNRVAQYLMFLLGVALVAYFFRRVVFHLRRAHVRERGQLTVQSAILRSAMERQSYLRNIVDTCATIFEGMAVTFSYLFRRPVTVQYPDRMAMRVQDTLPFRYRGILEVDLEICTGCLACERACPIDCIVIDVKKDAQTKGMVMTRFDIDMAKCMYCGLCSEPCPTGAIRHTPEFEGADYSLESLIRRFVKDPVVAYKPKKAGEDDPEILEMLDRGMRYVEEFATPEAKRTTEEEEAA